MLSCKEVLNPRGKNLQTPHEKLYLGMTCEPYSVTLTIHRISLVATEISYTSRFHHVCGYLVAVPARVRTLQHINVKIDLNGGSIGM